jgi:hypothetical protein
MRRMPRKASAKDAPLFPKEAVPGPGEAQAGPKEELEQRIERLEKRLDEQPGESTHVIRKGEAIEAFEETDPLRRAIDRSHGRRGS